MTAKRKTTEEVDDEMEALEGTILVAPTKLTVVGRPAFYKTVKAMQDAITEYFDNPPVKITVINGVETQVPKLTITGLALHLGFDSRTSFYAYEAKPEFMYTLKRARMLIENCYEMNLTDAACTGSIFALKNFGWSDKIEIEDATQSEERTTLTDIELARGLAFLLRRGVDAQKKLEQEKVDE